MTENERIIKALELLIQNAEIQHETLSYLVKQQQELLIKMKSNIEVIKINRKYNIHHERQQGRD
jgi:GH43 family beta-xylosidase